MSQTVWERNRHTPMTALYAGPYDSLVGYQCGHCGMVTTPNGTPSQPDIILEPVPGAKRVTRPNKAHKIRVKAAK